MNPIIRVENLSCQSGNRYLLRDINWQVQQGDALLLEDAFDGSSVLKLRFSDGSAVQTYLIEKDASGKIVLVSET